MTFKLSTRIEGSTCTLGIDRLATGVVLLRIEGHDVGEFGDLPLRCLEALLPATPASELYVDARAARGVTMQVSSQWARWMAGHRDRLSRVHMLTASRYVAVTADFVKRFAGLGGAMQLYDDAPAFEAELLRAAAGP